MDAAVIRKHGGQGARYTSYPAVGRFVEAFDGEAYRYWLANRRIGGFTRPLGLYVHVPFCDASCFHCAHDKIATRDHSKAGKYIGYLEAEMALVAAHLGGDRRVSRMRWGGGTPTFLGEEETARLMGAIRSHFELEHQGEYAIEIDPNRVDAGRIASLARLGFNRASISVQDFDFQVQRALNRVQGFAQTKAAIDAARASGFRSVSLDLLYGLPRQTAASFERTLDRMLEWEPDRIELDSYAHLPAVFKPQRRIHAGDLPRAEEKRGMMLAAIRRLGKAGYVQIGVDRFAKAADELAVAQGRLTCDFMGPSAGGECDVVGLGVSAIGKIGPTYCQNVKALDDYYGLLEHGQFPVLRGIQLTPDDLARRAIIHAFACRFMVSRESIEIAHLIEFDRYFAAELRDLERLAGEGLVELDGDWIHVTPAGRLVVPAVCAVFDKYLKATTQRMRYSRVT
jgi:oxygen-independent coproporphyrinogen-3 oxidase